MTRVLVIDDDVLVRETLQQMLTRAGFEVTVAGDGGEALELLEAGPVDIVVTDIIMPGKEGIETIGELRRRYGALPIIAMSGGGRTSDADFLQLASALGADATLKKPFKTPQLAALIKQCLGGSGGEPAGDS